MVGRAFNPTAPTDGETPPSRWFGVHFDVMRVAPRLGWNMKNEGNEQREWLLAIQPVFLIISLIIFSVPQNFSQLWLEMPRGSGARGVAGPPAARGSGGRAWGVQAFF